MPARINGASTSQQNLTGSLQFYYCYTASPGAFTDPLPNPPEEQEQLRKVNIQVTGNIKDQSQKNFEILLQTIGFRAMPVVMGDPRPVLKLEDSGAPSLTGEGFVWVFSVEREDTFLDNNDQVGLLVNEIDGVILDSNVRLTTVTGSPSGQPKNIEFIRKDTLQ